VRLLLDTNAYTALRRGHVEVADLVRNAERLLFSVVVLGELLYGFRSGSRHRKNALELERFLDSPYLDLLDVTKTTADRFGRIASALRATGTPIPSNDIWIAAQTLESGADLVSFDRHFSQVPGLPCRLMGEQG